MNDSDEKTKFRTQSSMFNSEHGGTDRSAKSTSSRLIQTLGGLGQGNTSLQTRSQKKTLSQQREDPGIEESLQHTSNALVGLYAEMSHKARRTSCKAIGNHDCVSDVIHNMINE